MLVDDEAFYDSFELLQMKYFSICTIHNILLARLNNINFAESDIVIDSNPQAPTLNNAINAVSNATRTLRLGEEKEQGSAIRQGYEWRIRMSMESLKHVGIVLWGCCHFILMTSGFVSNIEVLDVSTSTLRLLYNDMKKKSTLRQLDFEPNILALCEKALLILRSVLPLARGVNPLNETRNVCNGNHSGESAINTLSNCLFICKYVVDIDLNRYEHGIEHRDIVEEDVSQQKILKTRLQMYKKIA